jgi:S-disulfanyl-L-cysteine oxidoreductase SoxD
MSMHKHLVFMGVLGLVCTAAAAQESPNLGRLATPEEIAAYDIDASPDGSGLPPGSGTAKQGETVYAEKCLGCHGPEGKNGPVMQLVGGAGTIGVEQKPLKTVGSFWPYATSVFAYTRRSMPFYDSKSLTNDELYATTAYVLYLNGLVGEDDVINAETLPKVQMPNRDGFVPFKRGD